MLMELKVKDFAIIDHIQLQFGKGLNIISGETGAGKSILVRSLGLLMGGKSHAEDIRQQSDVAIVEGLFDLQDRSDIKSSLQEFGISHDEDELIVRRIFSRDGKNKVYLNGHLSSLADLKNIVAPLVEVTGRTAPLIEVTSQSENKNLLSSAYHLDLLDQYCDNWTLRKKINELFVRHQTIDSAMADLKQSAQTRSQRLDFIKYQMNEIETLNLDTDKDGNIEDTIKQLKNHHVLSSFYQQTTESLDGSISTQLGRILQSYNNLKFKPEALSKTMEMVEEAKKLLQEASYQISSSTPSDDDQKNLDTLESRLSDIRKLQKKFGPSIEDINQALETLQTELSELESAEERISQYELEQKAILTELKPLCLSLRQKRQQGSEALIKKVNAELIDLNMKGVLFGIQLEALTEMTASGLDRVLFTVKNGAQGEERPLQKTASGGELSRILLSLKISVGKIDHPRCYLFDEVDTGVSGPTAQKVGKKLKSIARGQQVICITHLPQVASFGDQHYFISKKTTKGTLVTSVTELSGTERIEEIARLISGETVSSTSRAHAKQLLQDAR